MPSAGDPFWSVQKVFLPTSAHDLLNHFQLLQAGQQFEQMFMFLYNKTN
jgi:hypothetical protein